MEETKKRNPFVVLFEKIKNSFFGFGRRFKDGSISTKVSHFVMGFGNLTRKQIVKGILFLLVEIIFILFMVLQPGTVDTFGKKTPLGAKALVNLVTLGTDPGQFPFRNADNSLLMLLYGVITIMVIVVFIGLWLAAIKSSYKTDLMVREEKTPSTFIMDLKTLVNERIHFTMLTPAIIGILVLTIIPNIFMILIAFTNYGPGALPPNQLFTWVGVSNFGGLFNGTELTGFWGVLAWTLIWAVAATFTNYFLGILLATLINNKFVKLKKMWRTIFILTIAIPQFVSLLMMRVLLSEYGPINSLLMNLGLIDSPILFLGSATNNWMPRLMVILINIWVGIPYTMLMTSGILMNVPKDLYEAADIDGATSGQKFKSITMPYIIFITTPYLISSFMGNITSFNIIYLLTGGGPNANGPTPGGTDLLVTWLFRLTIDQNYYSTGAVVSILTFVIMAVGTLLTYRKSKSYKDEEAFQ